MELIISFYPTGLTEYRSENDGILNTYSNGSIGFQRDDWDEVRTISLAEANEWLANAKPVFVRHLDLSCNEVLTAGTRPTHWD